MDDARPDMTVTYVDGLAEGMVIQFGTGEWREGTVRGPAISEDAFDLLEPLIRRSAPEWKSGSRYGVTPISRSSLASLINALHEIDAPDADVAQMISRVQIWLSDMAARNEQVSIFGI